jgi:hypothetical protein
MSKRDKIQEKGSALLVVLGFLTFMIISAVSFSIYMRTERQASSNYRHSITARHLLESALYRAMDEVDADLRGARYTYPGEIPAGSSEPLTKFPTFPTHVQWEGRVFTSKSNTPEVEDARVLSLEALSFLPGAVVNDARYYSASTPDQKAFGAKWRRMSMPITSRVDMEKNPQEVTSAGNKSYVGRYAYICVNLSDMINVNSCTNAVRGASNLVSVASLFADQNSELINWPQAEKFAEQASKDISYTTLQDFYACMAEQGHFNPASPYIQFLQGGGNTVFNDAKKHLLVTDGFAKERAGDKDKVCNLGDPKEQPLTKTVLDGTAAVASQLQSDFVNAIKLVDPLAPGSYINGALPGLLADYLSEDSKEARGLAVPAVKLTPMICQFIISPLLYSEVRKRMDLVNGKPMTTLELQLFPDDVVNDPAIRNLSFQMRVCHSFKNLSDVRRNRTYKIKITGTVRVLPVRPDAPTSAKLFTGIDKKFECEGTMTPKPGVISPTEDDCYVTIKPLTITGPAFDTKQVVEMLTIDDTMKVTAKNGFEVGKPFSVLLIIDKAQVFNPEGKLVDSVPYNNLVPAALDIDSLPKLYFETNPETLLPTLADKKQLIYDWKSLEVPDPRFNHFTCNWVNNTADNLNTAPGMHVVTRDLLLGKDGRDGDIFMTVSGRKNLESPGELGFLIRPFSYKGSDPGADFRSKIKMDPANDESDAFFRTFRLYAHDTKPRDNVYKYFINAVDDDGALPLVNNVRINPLSTSKEILKMAISAVPYDYSPIARKSTDNITDGLLKDVWKVFSDKWVEDIMKVVDTENLAKDLAKNIATCDNIAKMKWYDTDPLRQRLKCLDVALPKPLHEIDRKMLYAFSLDSMSDRQQLFLYVFQAESLAPISFAGMRSLSGGRAVALVWRDPYPKGSTPDAPNGLPGTPSWFANSTPGGTRGYHEQKILFFKQLDN